MRDMNPMHEQLRQAWERSGLSLTELAAKAGLDCGSNSLSRKLRGKQTLSTSECERLVAVLGVVVVAAPPTATANQVAG